MIFSRQARKKAPSAGLQGGDGQGRVHIGPGADADGVDLAVLDDLQPVGRDPGDGEFVGHALAGFNGAVGHRHHLHARLVAQPGDMHRPGVAAGADDADANGLVRHALALPIWVFAFAEYAVVSWGSNRW